ncbi:hypothetical protein SUGI_0078450 [Cryptomeria japonica]|uniref:transcription factor MYB46-like n=1 Tax=Cryptomeria japonica TaxID=3369 RepID=UPI002408C129|nr:transcription factor MYB46-like [Cryptomeria japonica]GLJ07961.1 hypothetical protein SUGI_0078450 [Cryptomeria japonica]
MGKTPCCSNVGMKKGFWTPEEDLRLIKCIQNHGEGNWRTIPLKAGLLRCGKACRLRWMNYLRPDIKRGHISADEEDLILRLHKLVGNRWSLIAGRIPGRTDNEIKNHWNSHLSKRVEALKLPSSQGINNGFPISQIEEVYNARAYASQGSVEPMQNFKQISDGYNFSNVFNIVGGAPCSYGDRPSSSMTMPCNFLPQFISTTGTSAGYENKKENINIAESYMQLRSTMLRAECDIQIPLCGDEIKDAFTVDYDNAVEPMQNFKQISDGYDARTAINDFSTFSNNVGGGPWCFRNHPSSSFGEEIDDAFKVDYDNMAEAQNGKNMADNSSVITAECWEPFSASSDWLDAPNDYILSVEDYW